MNINEMTGNGTNFWIFIVTSLALLIGAMCFWRLSSRFQGVWDGHMDGRRPENLSLTDRTIIIYASIQTRNFIWMIKEGILLGLVSNNLFGEKTNAFGQAWNKFYGDWTTKRAEKRRTSSV
jgi:hypothetical protein